MSASMNANSAQSNRLLRMHVLAKVGLVVLGYVIAFACAVALTILYMLLTDTPDKQASGGMAAFGELILGLALFGLLSLVPTALAVYFVRPGWFRSRNHRMAAEWRLHDVVCEARRRHPPVTTNIKRQRKMDMQIDSALIKSERRNRGWSQEQLAEAAGLGVRTIQRLESSGIASNESAKALAAVFELPLARLFVEKQSWQPLRARLWRLRLWGAGVAGCFALAAPFLLVSRANATDIAIAVVMTTDIDGESRMSLDLRSGQQDQIILARNIKFLITPTVTKQGIFVATEVYGWDGSVFKLAGKPSLLMRDGIESALQVNLRNGHVARIRMTPKAS